jgi:hypothetical protein
MSLLTTLLSSAGGGNAATRYDGEVSIYSSLPTATDNNGKVYLVETDEGDDQAGLYRSNGTIWSLIGQDYDTLDDIPEGTTNKHFTTTSESNISANNAKVSNVTHTGDVTGSASLTIADDAVTNAKMETVSSGTVKGRTSSGVGDVENLDIETTLKTALVLTKSDVGLSNVDNTSDINKPISNATQTALGSKIDDSQVLTNVPENALFTDTTYTVGDGGLTQKNFTPTLKDKLDGVEALADVTDSTNVSAAGALMTTGGTMTGALQIDDDMTVSGLISQTGLGGSTYLGEDAGKDDDLSDNRNVGIGYHSMLSNTEGDDNTAIGYESLYSNTTGKHHTAIGKEALSSNTTGERNTAIGTFAQYDNTTGDNNTAVGYDSMYNNTTGERNTAIGTFAQHDNTTGDNNTAVGYAAGRVMAGVSSLNETGSNSVFIGMNARTNANNQTNQIVIGYEAIGNGSNTVTIGNDSITETILKGTVGIGTTTPSPSYKLDVTGDVRVVGSMSKSSGSFDIPHPDPIKKETHRLRHYFVETPSAGGNIYKYQLECKKGGNYIDLPDYFEHLNKNSLVWANPFKHFGRAWGEVVEGGKRAKIMVEKEGIYNILIFGDRKDEIAMKYFNEYGIEYRK